MVIPILLLIVGLVILILGAEALVRGASSLAKKMGISSLVIGLTVVAFGTSMPEMVVSVYSAFTGNTDIAIGNVVGSNIANILLILGAAAIIYPISVKDTTAWREIPFALLAIILVFTMGNDGWLDKVNFNAITRTDGLSLLSLFFIFLVYTYGLGKQKGESGGEVVKQYPISTSALLCFLGIGALTSGGKLVVDNATILARLWGMSDSLIGLTIVAVGTSLPELATSVVAAIKKQSDIVVGNVIGSCIFNVFWILGVSSLVSPLPFSATIDSDVLVAIIATLITFMALFVGSRNRIDRWQGIVFVSSYVVYVLYLIHRG